MNTFRLLVGDALEQLRTLPAESVQTCVTSPPYWNLRDYGVDGQLGLEPTVSEYVARLVGVMEQVRRVLRDDGTLWLNLGDSYAGARGGAQGKNGVFAGRAVAKARKRGTTTVVEGLKHKDKVGVPWRVAFALQDAGWWLRSEIIWHKPNAMPEAVNDRPSSAHEHVFLLSKSAGYFYSHEAAKERAVSERPSGNGFERPERMSISGASAKPWCDVGGLRNWRDVWSIATQPSPLDHFAAFPEELARRCIVGGSLGGQTVLDPFAGTGTTGVVALKEGRHFVGIELNPAYAAMAEARANSTTPSLFGGAA